MRLNDFFLNICRRDIANEGTVSICTSLVQKWGSENLENIHTFLKLVWRLILTSEVIQMRSDDFFLIICMRDSPNEGILTIWTYSVQKCCLENLQNIHFFFKLVWRLILTSEVIKMRSEDFFFKICLRGIPTEDILSVCATLNQKWGHQVLGIMLWGDQTGPFKKYLFYFFNF